MGKNKMDEKNEPEKQQNRTGKRPGQKSERQGKPKKAQPEHLQHIPFKLREIMKSKERLKKGLLNPKKPKKVLPAGDPCDGDIPVPHFKRRKRESEKAYMRRMENETKRVLFLTKNQVDRKPEQDADEVKPGSKSKSEKKKEYDSIKLQRLQQKKLDRQEARMEKQMFVDDVPFGEVVLAPPSLSTKPKNARVKSQKDSGTLLLHSLLGHSVTSANKPSMARQRIMEEERERAVQAYRCLKKQRQEQHEARTANIKKLMDLQG